MTPRRQKGGALLYVLWASLVISALLAMTSSTTRTELAIARSQTDLFKLNQAMRAGALLAAFKISRDRNALSSRTLIDQPIGGFTITANRHRSYAPMDLNSASSDQFAALFKFLGADAMTAIKIGDEIIDWRDADSQPSPFGAEADDYRHAPPSQRPPNRRFLSVDELFFIKSISPELAACARPVLSIIGGAAYPGDGLTQSVYGVAPPFRTQKQSRSRLATSAHSGAAGEQFQLLIEGANPHAETPSKIIAVNFRVSGSRDKGVQLLTITPLLISDAQSEPSHETCINDLD